MGNIGKLMLKVVLGHLRGLFGAPKVPKKRYAVAA
jgi:hypothetical protein